MTNAQDPSFTQILSLLIALFGLAIILTRGRVFGWLLSNVVGAILWVLGLSALVILLLVVLNMTGIPGLNTSALFRAVRDIWSQRMGQASPPPYAQDQDPVIVKEQKLLSQYKLLSQLDPDIYSSPQSTWQLDPDGLGGYAERSDLTSLETVYTMLARGHGDIGAIVDDFYDPSSSREAIANGVLSGTVQGVEAYDKRVVLDELADGHPVIIGGNTSSGEKHYMLAIGYMIIDASGGRTDILVNDPIPESGKQRPGRRLIIDGGASNPYHPDWQNGSLRLTFMRRVTL